MGLVLDSAERDGLIKDYGTGTVTVGAQSRALAAVTVQEVSEFMTKLDSQADELLNPLVARMTALDLDDILTLMRAVKEETAVEFQGMTAKGNALDIQLVRPVDLTRIGGSTTPVTWLLNITSTGAGDWLGTSGNEESLSRNEGFIFLGAIDPVEVPKVGAIQFYRFTDALGPAQATFLRDRRSIGDFSVPAFRFPRPIYMLPEATYYARAYYEETGFDRLEPVGFHVARRADITNL